MKVGSLFSGIGGIDLGFIQAGCEIAFANEFDRDATNTYRHNLPNAMLIEGDIRTINADALPNVDILIAGFPCQPFSVCGYQKGFEDERGNLFFEICRILEVNRPEAVFLENVANLVKHDNGHTFEVIRNSLSGLGYTVQYAVMDAFEYGVPQHRTRTYIVGFLNSERAAKFSFPDKQPLTKHVFDIIDKSVPVEDALYLDKNSSKYRKMSAAIDDDNQVYRFSDYGVQKGKDGISFTLKANMGTWYDREPIIKDINGIRKLSPKECLMLQGFPEEFEFPDIPAKSAYKQAGNTVCVPVVKLIAEKIKACLSEKTDDFVLVGVVRNENQLNISLENNFYHFPVSKMPEGAEKATFVALRLPKLAKKGTDIKYIGRIKSRVTVPRSEISFIPKKSDKPYCLITVESWKPIKCSLPQVGGEAVNLTCLSRKMSEELKE